MTARIDADSCTIDNISAGGMYIRTRAPMPIGTPVRVQLTKPGVASSLLVSGRVVSVVGEAAAKRNGIAPGVGVELDRMPLATEKQLHVLLRELGLHDLQEPTEIEPNSLYATTSADTAHEATNVRGLLDMLTDAMQKLKDRDDEILLLKEEIRKLKTAKP